MTQRANDKQGAQRVLFNNPQTQLNPQEPNRDRYGDQETGATSGEVGDGRSQQQTAVSGSQATQHSTGGTQQQDSERATGLRGDSQQAARPRSPRDVKGQ
ncbi:hypothetical protein ACFFTM_17220 [Pseudoduganella plicata]|uniref:Uncharacterized protein n=1 Tax=Pseudoduganella plicata TaxID=321984 RepID=A0A4P7BAE1_9BURK|nr:hypothetical protein [Pseudoduganella plicata]QBQ35070.1 hypothetical protein E1742_01950 [Pseudoduganella plicata]GGZ10001.1 hypothetical protein GCM10007388_49360 [Pseudoduganella plicata]